MIEQPQSDPPSGLAALLRAAFHDEDLSIHVPGLITRAARPEGAAAMLDLALVLQLRFQKEAAMAVLDQALQAQQLFHLDAGDDGAVRVLVIKVPGDLMSNTPLECILEGAGFAIDVLYVDTRLPWPDKLPPHDLVFVAISEADTHGALLEQLGSRLANWPCPVLNPAQRIPALSRSEAFAVLRGVPGICITVTRRIDRAALESILADPAMAGPLMPDVVFPVILRPLGSHAGTDLDRIDTPAGMAGYLRRVKADAFFAASFIDYASPDGLFRKYRIVLIDGRAFVCHMGISAHWMVHYPYEEMKADPARRAEEAAFMAGFDQDFAVRHADALAQIQLRFGLDYVGFDCAETRDGRLLIFEMANALVIHAMDDPLIFPYKAAQMRKVFAAFHGMLRQRACSRT